MILSLFCEVGEDNVHTALSLVGYESDLRKAMEYVFGSTLVCDTLDNAKKVAFDKQVMTKTVTLGGDIFDPQGTLSGGEINTRLLFPWKIKSVSILGSSFFLSRRSLAVGIDFVEPAGSKRCSGQPER